MSILSERERFIRLSYDDLLCRERGVHCDCEFASNLHPTDRFESVHARTSMMKEPSGSRSSGEPLVRRKHPLPAPQHLETVHLRRTEMKTLTDSERPSTFANATFVTFAQLRKSANDRSVGSGFGRRTEPNVDGGRRRHGGRAGRRQWPRSLLVRVRSPFRLGGRMVSKV